MRAAADLLWPALTDHADGCGCGWDGGGGGGGCGGGGGGCGGGRVEKFVEIPPLLVAAVAAGLSLAGAGQALAVGSSAIVLRSPLGSPNAHVHFSTGSAARRYLLALDGVSARSKLLR